MDDSVIGLAGLGFWLFIAAAAVSSIWEDIRKREAHHETLRALIASGQPVDQAALDRLLGKSQRMDREMRVSARSGAIVLRYIAFGVAALGLMMSFIAIEVLFALLGAAALLGLLSLGIAAAADYAEQAEDEQPTAAPTDLILPGRTGAASEGAQAPPPHRDHGA